ncbi:Stress response protein nst1, partial [Kickxella alabastrina]
MALSATTSPPTQAHLDSSKRKRAAEDKSNSKDGSKSRPDCSTSSNTYSLEPQTHQTATKLSTVYGPELPPSMARSKAPSTAIDSEILPSMENFADIAQLLASECHDDSSRVECMKRAENVLQCLFRSRLMAIMNHYGYKDNEFTKKDLARVMVNIGLISSVTDDPVLAMASRVASKVKAEMPNIVRTKMQLSADLASNPDLLTDIAVDSISIDALVDISREGSILSNDSAAIAAAIACANAYFEDAMKTMSNISVTECFSLAELYQDQLYADPEPADSPLSARQWTTRAATPPPPQPPAPVLQQQTVTQKAQPSTSTSTSMPTITAAATATNTSAPASAKQSAATTSKDLVIDSTSATAGDAGQLLKKGKKKRSKRKSKGKKPDLSTGVVEAPTLAVMALDLSPAQPHTHVHKTATVKIAPLSRAVCTSASPAPTPALAHSSATSLGKQADASSMLWNSDSVEEQKQVRRFWLEISDVQRQALILVEKEVVLARVRDHQNFSCSCNVCTRKREAIEHELDCLYDCYFEELQESVRRERMRMMVHEAEKKARSTIMSSVHAIAESMVIKMITERDPSKRKEDVQKSIHESIKQSRLNGSLFDSSLKETEAIIEGTMRKVAAAAAVSGIAKPIREGTPNVPNEVVNVGEAALAIKEWADGAFNFRREFGDESLQSDVESDEAFNNNDLFYTEHMLDTIDTFPTDSKKFFDMMERLAEYRMRREDALQDLVDGHGSSASAIEATYDAHTRSGMSSHTWVRRARESARQQRRCPDCHGEISECEEQPPCFPATTKASAMSSFVRKHPESGAIIHSLDGPGAEDFLNSLDDSDYEDIDDDDEEDDDDDDEDDEGDLEVDIEDELYDSDHDDEDEDEDDELDETDDDFDDLDSEGAEREAEEGRKVFQLFAARLFEQRVINAYREKVALDRQQNLIKELEEEEKRNAMKDKRKQIKREQEKERKRKSQLKKEEERMAKEYKVKAEQQRKREADEKKHQEMMAKKREQDIKMKKAQEERNRKILEEADRRMEKEKAERK